MASFFLIRPKFSRPRLLLLGLMVWVSGCAVSPLPPSKMSAGHCDPPFSYRYSMAMTPKENLEESLTPELLARYPRRNLLAANAVGILPALQTLVTLPVALNNHSDLAKEVGILKQRQLILNQVLLVSSTISSLAAELDCEGERADQMAGQLTNLDNIRTQRLNVLSIAIGALSGLGTTVSENQKTQYVFGIGGGLVGAGLGLLTLNQEGHVEDFWHSRNLLTEVWNESASSAIWPPSIWYMLTNPAFSNQGQTSIAHNSRERWRQDSQFSRLDLEQSRRLAELLFGVGGSYTAEHLKLRANMLNELQSSVRLLNQEIQGLLLALLEE